MGDWVFFMKEIELSKGYTTQVDDDDYEWLNKYSWYANVGSSGVRAVKNKTQKEPIYDKMHRMILGITDGNILTDHKDHNPLNNQRSNLRECNDRQNACNSKSAKNSTSKYLGVSFQKTVIKRKTKTLGTRIYKYYAWRATIFKDYKQISIGRFKTEKEAAIAYNVKAIELHGEFANINII